MGEFQQKKEDKGTADSYNNERIEDEEDSVGDETPIMDIV